MMDNEIYEGWIKALESYKPRYNLTPLEKLQLEQIKAHEEYCKTVPFVLGEPLGILPLRR